MNEECFRFHIENPEFHPNVVFKGFNGDINANNPRLNGNGYKCFGTGFCYIELYFSKF